MPFGFGTLDFGFTERNPFGVRGQATDYSRQPSGGMVFNRLEGVPGVNMSAAPNQSYAPSNRAYPIYKPNPNSSLFNTALSSVRAPRVSSTPRPATTPTPQVRGSATQASNIRNTAKAPTVDPNAEYNQQINELYGGTANFLQGLQESIRGSQDNILGAIGSQFDAQRPMLQQARDDLMFQNQSQQEGERVNQQNALAEARNLYSELGQANRQRFGGTSSTGEFANAIQGREFQRGQSRINQTSQANLQTLQQQASSIEKGYQSQLIQLESQKNSALSEARAQFEERVRQIDSLRAENEQSKAAAKLEALRELRTKAENIENQKRQFQQQLESQTLAAAQNIYSAVQAYAAEQGKAPDLAGLPGAEFSTLLGNQRTSESALPQGFFRKPEAEPFTYQGLFQPEYEDQLAPAF